ncbi:MAG: hypothetical protein M3P30_04085 [Chloroflexota bacterium]|nr:hypothetical protein [Chloroflexota bacterium]
MIDVSGLMAEAQAIVQRAAEVYIRHAGDTFVGLIAHGSAVKGGIIPGCSDVDLQLYLRDSAFTPDGHPPLERQIAIHRDLSRIDPAPFHYIQCYAFGSRLAEGWVGPVPGAYRVVAGRLPVPEATAEELQASADSRLATLDPLPSYLKDNLLEHGPGRLARHLRLLCTDVWPTLYQLLIVEGGDAVGTWNLPKQAAMDRLRADTQEAEAIRGFYHAVCAYFPGASSIDAALDAVVHGVAFLTGAKQRAAELREMAP